MWSEVCGCVGVGVWGDGGWFGVYVFVVWNGVYWVFDVFELVVCCEVGDFVCVFEGVWKVDGWCVGCVWVGGSVGGVVVVVGCWVVGGCGCVGVFVVVNCCEVLCMCV